jgi:hypothetical protein
MKKKNQIFLFFEQSDEWNGRKPSKWSINLPWKTRRVIGGSLLDIHIEAEPSERERETVGKHAVHASIHFQSQKKSQTSD